MVEQHFLSNWVLCTALNTTALLYMQWGDIIYDEVLLFDNCTIVPSFSKNISKTFIVLWYESEC